MRLYTEIQINCRFSSCKGRTPARSQPKHLRFGYEKSRKPIKLPFPLEEQKTAEKLKYCLFFIVCDITNHLFFN